MRLSAVLAGRDNNFNLLRFVAASAVLFSHCFALFHGNSRREPLLATLGMTPGTIAVDVFFVTSGFLVTGSILGSRRRFDFIVARGLRIFPGLAVMTLLSAFGLGLYFTTLPARDFLAHATTHIFLWKNLSLFWGTTGSLPGVFEGLPFPRAVNASLWTLPFEVRMYALLFALWLPMAWWCRERPALERWLLLAAGGITALSLALHFRAYLGHGQVDDRFRLLFMFFSGACFYLLRQRVVLNGRVVLAMAALLGATAAAEQRAFFVAYTLVLAYGVFWLAYVPGGAIRRFNRVGDYSYGIYIYAFPVQQSLLALLPGIGLPAYIGLSFLATGVFAALSWHAVESPVLAWGAAWRARAAGRLPSAPAQPPYGSNLRKPH